MFLPASIFFDNEITVRAAVDIRSTATLN